MYQAEIFVDGGRSFANQARLSAAGIPQIAVVHGSSTAGGRLPAGAVGLRGAGARALQHLPGRPAAGEGGDRRGRDRRGTRRRRHARQVTGLGEYLTENDAMRHRLARADGQAALGCHGTARPAFEPRRSTSRNCWASPADEREPYDVREVIARLVDGSDFLEFKAGYGSETMCGHARITAIWSASSATTGRSSPTGSTKAAQFIQLATRAARRWSSCRTPPATWWAAAERAGAIKHGSKMIQAVANARVPKFTIVIGGSFGAGNYGMCGRGFDPRFIFAWPSARTPR